MAISEVKAKREWALANDAPRFWAIVDDVCAESGVKRRDICGPTRGKAPVSAARDLVARRAFNAGFRVHAIAELLGRDWSSVSAMLKRSAKAKAPELPRGP